MHVSTRNQLMLDPLHLLLLHKLRVWAVIHHVFTKNWGGERAVDFLRIQVFVLSIEYEVITLHPQAYSRLLPEEYEGKDVTILQLRSAWRGESMGRKHSIYLFSATEKELVRINSVGNGTSKERHPVENDRRLIGVLEYELVENVEYDSKRNEREKAGKTSEDGRCVGQYAQRLDNKCKDAHDLE